MINTIGTCSADLFNMKINYHTANAALGATGLYNGNISTLSTIGILYVSNMELIFDRPYPLKNEHR